MPKAKATASQGARSNPTWARNYSQAAKTLDNAIRLRQ